MSIGIPQKALKRKYQTPVHNTIELSLRLRLLFPLLLFLLCRESDLTSYALPILYSSSVSGGRRVEGLLEFLTLRLAPYFLGP